jgi:hypothetical protein
MAESLLLDRSGVLYNGSSKIPGGLEGRGAPTFWVSALTHRQVMQLNISAIRQNARYSAEFMHLAYCENIAAEAHTQ